MRDLTLDADCLLGSPQPAYSLPIGWMKMPAQLHMETSQSAGSKLPPYC